MDSRSASPSGMTSVWACLFSCHPRLDLGSRNSNNKSIVIEVFPFGVFFFDQLDFPRAVPRFQSFLARDRIPDIPECLKPDELENTIFRRKAAPTVIAMLPDPAGTESSSRRCKACHFAERRAYRRNSCSCLEHTMNRWLWKSSPRRRFQRRLEPMPERLNRALVSRSGINARSGLVPRTEREAHCRVGLGPPGNCATMRIPEICVSKSPGASLTPTPTKSTR